MHIVVITFVNRFEQLYKNASLGKPTNLLNGGTPLHSRMANSDLSDRILYFVRKDLGYVQ